MKNKIKFNSFYSSSNYTKNLEKLFSDYDLFRKKHFSNKCINLLQKTYSEANLWLTHSATGALEMIALALNIKEGDEIILPSYTFVSTANAFALRGAKLVFVDIELDTFGIDPQLVEQAITKKTKAIVCMHYAGHACKIDELVKIAKKNKLYLIEDAAMAFGSTYKNKPLGTFGDFGVVSFDITKHIVAAQGGLLVCNNKKFSEVLNNTYHLGTNRVAFEKGNIPYYEWVSLGSKYQMPELNSVVLYEQLKQQEKILKKRVEISKQYYNELKNIKSIKIIDESKLNNNVHEFYILCQSEDERKSLNKFLAKNNIEAMFHYIPLHNSKFGKEIGTFVGLNNTKLVSEGLLRLPLHNNLTKKEVLFVCNKIKEFFKHE
ncbi:MAG: dTDP-4-amino-4,6-dideoxygalactose transaminase [Bacteroidetes bacterium]|nr:dTDP-4-amino-4,6-dideoxygalactose transaminase [Bacteroidota bacterium]MCB9225581.1 dTDP-4-amino-4,6-dideoxygalactose transaminase [Chitinophagales bacterium]